MADPESQAHLIGEATDSTEPPPVDASGKPKRFLVKGACEDCPQFQDCPKMRAGPCANPLQVWIELKTE